MADTPKPHPADPPLSPPSHPLTPAEQMALIERYADEGDKEALANWEDLLQIRADLWGIQNRIDRMMERKTKTSAAFGSIRHAARTLRTPVITAVVTATACLALALSARAFVLVPGSPAVAHHDAAAPLMAAAVHAQRNHDFPAAACRWREAFRAGGDFTLCLRGVAECELYQDHHAAALAAAEELIDRNPACAQAYTLRGLVYLKTGRRAEALEQFRHGARMGDDVALTHLPGGGPRGHGG